MEFNKLANNPLHLIRIQMFFDLAAEHAKNCKDENCNISVMQLKEIAREYIYNPRHWVDITELNKMEELLRNWPI